LIAYRTGFGDLLAEGLLRTGETPGEEAKNLFQIYGLRSEQEFTVPAARRWHSFL
jgi:hypothetical protein